MNYPRNVYLVFLLIPIFLFPLRLNGQVVITLEELELACQVVNIVPELVTDKVKFVLTPISSTRFYWETSCIYTEGDFYTSTIEFQSDWLDDQMGYNLVTGNEPHINGTMLMALNKVEIMVDNIIRNTFFYENRDAKYYSGCEGTFSHDITIKYDVATNIIWFKNAGPSKPGIWENISGETLYIWELAGLAHTPLDFNGAPEPPTNLTLSGNIGQNPTLSWDFNNNEPDMAKYDLFQSFNSGLYSYLATIDESINSYTDNGVIITNLRLDDLVSYKIKARDLQGLSSEYSNMVSTRSNTLNKGNENATNLDSPIQDYFLSNPFPNPFNPTTKIYYSIPQDDFVTLNVYDQLGKLVTTLVKEQKSKGNYFAIFDAKNLSSGIYIYTIRTNNFTQSKKMILTK